MRTVLTPEALSEKEPNLPFGGKLSISSTPSTAEGSQQDELEYIPDHLLRNYAITLRNHANDLENQLSFLHNRIAKIEGEKTGGTVSPKSVNPPSRSEKYAANVRLTRRVEELESKLTIEVTKHQETQQDRANLRVLCAKAKERIEELLGVQAALEKKICEQEQSISALKAKLEEHEAEIVRMRKSSEFGGLALDDIVLRASPETMMGFNMDDVVSE